MRIKQRGFFQPFLAVLIVFAVAVALAVVNTFAATPVVEQPIGYIGTPTCVSVSTSAWTKFPTSYSLQRRSGIKLVNKAANSASFWGVLSIGTPTVSTNTPSILIQTNTNPFVPNLSNVDLYLVSLNTAAESVCGQEVGQNP